MSKLTSCDILFIIATPTPTPATPVGYKLSGVWVCNDTFSINKTMEQSVNYTTNGKSGDLIAIEYMVETSPAGATRYTEYLSYNIGETTIYGTPILTCAYQKDVGSAYDGWQKEEYKTLDFGSTPQEVEPEFYDWFVANATKQS